ncbi:dimethylsulfoniopropionate lyase [Trinickia dinghuensis]|uniref:Transcriptional regulator n=1 Tax=Trinickia dinghuensis TaxID=2291023 RepID=A0A3D8JSW6_9BURK|nr:dimethylsulfoniopropionate lyase [Trinickia dinghuensis]RDU95766.1 transcriptional regulator [Trinickia dinghuensis]
MQSRPKEIQAFIDAARILFAVETRSKEARDLAVEIFARLEQPGEFRFETRERFPACDSLDKALEPYSDADDEYGQVAKSIKALEPFIGWSRRMTVANASPNFLEGHANGMICGPGGIEQRRDLQLGFTVMKPDVRYPDHSHPPEETYVLMTAGEFRKDRGPWLSPGIGGGIHNAPNAVHAVRSDDNPFLALWCLKI